MLHIRLVTLAVSAVFAFAILMLVRKRKLKTSYALLWLAVFAAICASALVPGLVEFISAATGLYYITALLFLSMLFMIVLFLHFSSVISQLVYQNRLLAERLAFLEEKMEAGKTLQGADRRLV